MLLEASRKYKLDLTKTVFIGDVGSTDMVGAHTVGAMKVLVLTGWEQGSLNQYRDNWAEVEPDYVAENLLDAVK
ncbi:HAD hydrolase-like protein [Rossellomorea vietnamensis]|uniref:HAD hydrolase-like protein n=1 Tax=Rossellomorea vietnamensis TaxID=218284 RepID=UPI001E2AAF68|nr:HAD hydrolase-like protein [Rossellomorea vietnamensis]